METYTVTVSQNPLGVTFTSIPITGKHRSDLITVEKVLESSIGAALGLSVGDQLIAINDMNLCAVPIEDIDKMNRAQQPPFTITLSRQMPSEWMDTPSSDYYDGDGETNSSDDGYVHLNSMVSDHLHQRPKWRWKKLFVRYLVHR